ncbi:hypothetical protein [Homoserinimonas sp. A520]
MDAFLALIIGTAVVVVLITARLAWREHRDRRLGSRLGYSWGASFNDKQQAARAAQREADPARMAGWLL